MGLYLSGLVFMFLGWFDIFLEIFHVNLVIGVTLLHFSISLKFFRYLGNKTFLHGDTPTTIDCALFGHLAQFLYIPLEFPQVYIQSLYISSKDIQDKCTIRKFTLCEIF